MDEDTAAPGHSREEGTLEWQLMQARSQMASLSHHALPASAVLHPLHASPFPPTRASFQRHLQHLRASVRRFIDETTAAWISAQQDENGQPKDNGPSDFKAKKQRIISLLREKSSHSAAISTAASQLQQPLKWDTLLSCYRDPASSKGAESASLGDVRKQIQQFVRMCETMAKDVNMEAFAEEHNCLANDAGQHTHTITLAASIIVVDVEVCLEVQSDGRWKPLVRVRLSYATDSTTTKPVLRDQSLADCLQIDMQAIADALLGWREGSQVQIIDSISPLMQHQARAKRTLQTLKRLDDMSLHLNKTSRDSSVPDLFSALDDVGRRLQATRQSSVPALEDISAKGGLLLQHVGSPYTSIVYHMESEAPLTAVSDVTAEIDRLTLSLVEHKPQLHFISITIIQSTAGVVQDTSPTALPKVDDGSTEGTKMLYTAVLHPPVMMPKSTAWKLSMKAGVVLGQEGVKSWKKIAADVPILLLADVPSYEDMLSTSAIRSSEDDNKLQYASNYGSGKDTRRQGVVVSHFPFASLQHLNEAIAMLRQQVQLNELLSCVSSSSSDIPVGEGKELTLQDLLSEDKEIHEAFVHKVSLATEENGICSILFNVPLGIDIWTLEVKLCAEAGHCSLTAQASKLGQEQGRHMLRKTSNQYKRSVALLDRLGGKGLKQMLAGLEAWAIDLINGNCDEEGMAAAPPEAEGPADADQAGPVPNVENISPSREFRESRSKGRRGSVADSIATDTGRIGTTTRRMSNAQSPVTDTPRRSTSVKRRASQAGMDDDDGQKRASRKKN